MPLPEVTPCKTCNGTGRTHLGMYECGRCAGAGREYDLEILVERVTVRPTQVDTRTTKGGR